MSWRSNAQRTGMNAQPLQGARRWGGGGGGGSGGGDDGSPPGPGYGSGSPPSNYQQSQPYQSSYQQPPQHQPYHQQQHHSGPSSSSSASNPRDAALAAAAAVAASIGIKRDAPFSSSSNSDPTSSSAADGGPRKRKSRWGDANPTTSTIPTAIGANVSATDLDKYAIQVRLDEISRKLHSGDFIPPDRERSPSPPPTYDNQGRRTNTRQVRCRKKLEDERLSLVERQLKLDPNFRPPPDYHAIKRNQRPTEKVYLPIKEFPEINFFGLLVGPRGNTLKTMERQSGAKISIRGKGSVKDGKGKGGDEDEEEMHCVVAADDDAAVKKCIRLINQVIETAASTPEGENDHKRNQLRELAALNGTLRDDENQLCKNCGNKGHRAFECPEQRNWTAHIICHRCGGQGHLARDCTQGRVVPGGFGAPSGPAAGGAAGVTGNRQFDSEYANLMAELGEPAAAAANPSAAGAGANAGPASVANGTVGADGNKIPPWRNPEVWTQPGFGAPRHLSDSTRGGAGWGGRGGYNNRGDRGAPFNSHQQSQYQQHGYQGYDQSQAAGAGAGGEGGEGQKDYSAEWAAYYAAQAAAGYTDPNVAAAAAGAAGGGEGQVDYAKEWEEYYRMQAAAAAQDGGAAAAYGAGAQLQQ
ncbi:hypothetical protein NDA16_004855 [Ustilago loliicola]|nr:hypothetical protein NDA16_004855 [Ustilago loliicola]